MSFLIGVINCHARQAYQKAIRDTWLSSVPKDKATVRFFLGRGAQREPREDEVFLDCGDGYMDLPEKVKAMFTWAYNHGFDFASKLDDDVILLPDKFLNSGVDQYDYVGRANDDRQFPVPFGFCYTLSKRAMKLVVEYPLPVSGNNDEVWVRDALSKDNIVLHHDERYHLHRGNRNDFIDPEKRPLRIPPRVVTRKFIFPSEGTFAWCMYITWLGYRDLPEEKNIEEMHRVFKRVAG